MSIRNKSFPDDNTQKYSTFLNWYTMPLLIFFIIFLILIGLSISVGINFKSDIVSGYKYFVKILVLYLLLVANFHLYRTLINDKSKLNYAINSICRVKKNFYSLSKQKYLIYIIYSFVFFLLYIVYIFMISPSLYDDFDPLLSIDIQRHQYQIDQSANLTRFRDTEYLNNIIYYTTIINDVVCKLFKNQNIAESTRTNYSVCYNIWRDIGNDTDRYCKLNERIETFTDLPQGFRETIIYKTFRYITYTNETEFNYISKDIMDDQTRIVNEYDKIYSISMSFNNSSNISDDMINNLDIYISQMSENASLIGEHVNDFTKEFDNLSKPFENNKDLIVFRTSIFDILIWGIHSLIFIVFLKCFIILTNVLHTFIKRTGNVEYIQFNNFEDCNRIIKLRYMKMKLNNYVFYLLIILALTGLIYLSMNDHHGRAYKYIEVYLINISIFIILILSSLSFKKMADLVENSAHARYRHIENILFNCNNDLNTDKYEKELKYLKDLKEEFSIHKNITLVLSSIAPLATFLITLWAQSNYSS